VPFAGVMQSHAQRVEDTFSLQEGHDQLYALQTSNSAFWRDRADGGTFMETGGSRYPRQPELERRTQLQVACRANERHHLRFIVDEGLSRRHRDRHRPAERKEPGLESASYVVRPDD
jgi:hypothetical protein